MSDDSFDGGLPEESRTPEEEALLRFLSQFGISPGPDGRVDLEELVARAQSMMAAFAKQVDVQVGQLWRHGAAGRRQQGGGRC